MNTVLSNTVRLLIADEITPKSTPESVSHNTLSTKNVVFIGDIFHCSFGYGMTLNEFYQVVGFTPSGKSVKLRQIASHCDNPNGWDGYETPVKDKFYDTKIITKRLKFLSGDTPCVNLSSFQTAFKMTDPTRACYFNHLD